VSHSFYITVNYIATLKGCVFDCKHVSDGFVCDDNGGKVCTTICGDKTRAGDEECDDGNNRNGDGCSAKCGIEDNWGCDENGVYGARFGGQEFALEECWWDS
jgi:cysteine-rich repeat protein